MFNPRLDYEIKCKCIYYHNTQTLWDSKSLDSRFLFVKERRDTPGTGDKPSHTDMVISLKRELRARARAHRRRGITLYPGYVSGAPRGNKVYIHGLETQTPLYRSAAWNRDGEQRSSYLLFQMSKSFKRVIWQRFIQETS